MRHVAVSLRMRRHRVMAVCIVVSWRKGSKGDKAHWDISKCCKGCDRAGKRVTKERCRGHEEEVMNNLKRSGQVRWVMQGQLQHFPDLLIVFVQHIKSDGRRASGQRNGRARWLFIVRIVRIVYRRGSEDILLFPL